MKSKTFIYICAAAFALAGCYDDKGGNDYDSAMPDVEITVSETAYSAPLGGTITIAPTITTTIPESDLQYAWEVEGEQRNDQGRECYMPLVPDEEQGPVLHYTCRLDENITSLQKSYPCRLRVRQLSTGRDFYSSEAMTITITGLTGLMVLHGDDRQCDVGILEAEEFTPSANSLPESPKATPEAYSMNNGGAKIAGRGIEVLQSVMAYMYNEVAKQRCRIYVKTTDGVTWANKDDFSYFGDWNVMFFLQGEAKVNAGEPSGYFVDGSDAITCDGGELFLRQQSSQDRYLFAEIGRETVCGDGNMFYLAPAFLRVASTGKQCVMYADKVNGQDRKGFILVSQLYAGTTAGYSTLADTKSDLVPFNPGDMKADIVLMRTDDRAHVMAVLKGESSHPSYAGKYFAVDLWPNAAAAGETGLANVPQFLYDLSAFPAIDDAISFEFGSTQNMCYYATLAAVYHYGVDGSTSTLVGELGMTDGSGLTFDGEITMMKLLNSPNIKTRNTEPILLVATYDGSQSALYALHLDTMTGRVLRAVKYDASNVEGWGFGRISDVNIKGL